MEEEEVRSDQPTLGEVPEIGSRASGHQSFWWPEVLRSHWLTGARLQEGRTIAWVMRLCQLINPPLFYPGEERWIGIGRHDGDAGVGQDVERQQAALFGDVSCKPLAIS